MEAAVHGQYYNTGGRGMREKRMFNISEAGNYIGLGRTKTMEFCNEIGATVHIGRRVLYDREVIDRAISERRESREGKGSRRAAPDGNGTVAQRLSEVQQRGFPE